MSQQFHLIVMTPAGLCDPTLAIAACRAGAFGVLDLEYDNRVDHTDERSIRTALTVLADKANGPFGVKMSADNDLLRQTVIARATTGLHLAVLTGAVTPDAITAIADLHAIGVTVLYEAIDEATAHAAAEAGADGVIAKGHEAGGHIGEESAFVLLQRLLATLSLPVYVHGGVGLHTVAACAAAGAAGAVLDIQVALTRESTLPEAVKERLAAMDGSETTTLGTHLGATYRFLTRPGFSGVESLRAAELQMERQQAAGGAVAAEWTALVRERLGWGAPTTSVLPIGQDGAFAASLARRYETVAGVLQAIRSSIPMHLALARDLRPLDEGSPLAIGHGTRYPITQGPMTRVSDVAPFARAVVDGGGLPWLALAVLRGPEVRALLEETKALLGDKPYGVGILGFVSPELRQEQIAVVQELRPPFALIAGGRPDQAANLERDGIPTYLHVPSPGLLSMFIDDGAHRFVFEGRECGGHVGPRTSFVLWETMIEALLAVRRSKSDPPIDVLFAGGIHDARSAAMIAVMAAPLAQRGMRLGVLMGTAYLFTQEAVSSGAILPTFQQEALECAETVILESGPGHASRCVNTPFVALFDEERRRMAAGGASSEEIHEALEDLNVGRLRIAAKGITRHPRFGQDPDAPKFITLDEGEQRAEGMYQIGQIAALHHEVTTIAALHHEVSVGGTALVENLAIAGEAVDESTPRPVPADVAIVGMSALFPRARDVQTYWENILNKVDAISEVPADRWDWRRYFDEDKKARDRVYSRWGGFLEDVPFDPLSYGMPPNTLPSIEPMQLLVLEAVRAALKDAGYDNRPFPRERTSVILGASGVSDLGLLYGVRSILPTYVDGRAEDLLPALADALPEWTEDSFAGVLMNVTAGRVTNRFDFGGTNYTVDAACASSLTAIAQGIKELQLGTADVALAGGADTTQNVHAFMSFSKTQALSANGRCRPFDANADGIAISEGAAIVVLKRLADAERDGDRIYAVIKGVGSSSDGRDKSLVAPRPEGQMRALRRAYAQAGFSPATVGLVEAHGTGTVVGDKTEVGSLAAVFAEGGATPGSTAIGSVKSMIGHTKAAAGVAGLVKVAMALHHRTLPPTMVEEPNTKAGFGDHAFYISSETRPWIDGTTDHPRRAGVSAFGFGGTNFHVVLEEYTGDYLPPAAPLHTWPTELFILRAATREALREGAEKVRTGLERGAEPRLLDLSYSMARLAESAPAEALTLAVVAASLGDLQERLSSAVAALDSGAESINDPRGVYFAAQPLARDGKVAFLFPGQGSQYVAMLRDLAIAFREIQEAYERAGRTLAHEIPSGLAGFVFPAPTFDDGEAARQQERLTDTAIAQPALGAADVALLTLLRQLGVEPEMTAGHSYGEFVALHAAGVYDEETLFRLSEARGRFMAEAAGSDDPGAMAAVSADAATVAAGIAGVEGVVLANLNSPTQTVISGTTAGVAAAVERLSAQGLRTRALTVSCAFHSPLVAGARDRLVEVMKEVPFATPTLPVFSNMTAQAYPEEGHQLAALLGDHLVSPVRFVEEITSMYAAGARLFVEVGPKAVLTGLAGAILKGKPHLCVASDNPQRHGLTQLQMTLAQLAAQGVPLQLDRLYRGREPQRLDPRTMTAQTGRPRLAPTTWLVNGGYARPLSTSGNPDDNRRQVTPVAITLDRAARELAPAPFPMTAYSEPPTPPSVVGGSVTDDPIAMREEREPVTDVMKTPPGLEPVTAGPTMDNGHMRNGHSAPPTPPTVAQAAAPWPTAPYPPEAAPSPQPMYVDELSATVMQFQNVMAQFLETQRTVMSAYFGQPGPTQGYAPQPQPVYLPAPQPVYVSAPQPTYLSAPQPTYTPPVQQYAPPAPAAPSTYAPPMAPVPAPVAPVPTAVAPTPVAPTPAPVAVAPAPAAVAPAPAPAAPVTTVSVMSEQDLTQHLLAIVAERTGYPTEMLDLDLDLEADLGIDSIKRVEIVGSLRRAVGATGIPDGVMEKLSAVKTLRTIVTSMMEVIRAAAHPPPVSVPATVTAPDASHMVAAVPRFTPRATTAPSAPSHSSVSIVGTVVVTDDEHGVAQGVASALRQAGHRVVVLRTAATVEEIGPELYTTNMADQEAVATALDLVRRRHGAIGGALHLLPLRSAPSALPGLPLAAWQQRLDEEVKGTYHLARLLDADLSAPLPAATGTVKRGVFLAATSMGGRFGLDRPRAVEVPGYFAGHGGVGGFLKTLGLEWPQVLVRALDLQQAPVEVLVEQIVAEVGRADDEIEVGRADGLRLVVESVAAPLATDGTPLLEIDPSWVILVTGGARGITAGVALEIARHSKPTLILAGRSPLPPTQEATETADLTEARAIKSAIIAQMRAAGEQPQPARVEAAFNRLMQDREMRVALADLIETGATIHYYAVDVRDEAAFSGLIAAIYESYGRLDGVIHGAGVIEDKLVRDKTPESFNRVFDTKTVSSFVLAQALRPETLKFLAFFSSVTARFGNRGQADYGATNDTVNKLAQELAGRWPGRVVSYNWGPWGAATPGGGMVAADIEAQFARRGVEMIDPAVGYRRALEELRFGERSVVEVVYGGGPWARGLRRMVAD